MTEGRYCIRTWDSDLKEFTPQAGVPSFNLTLYELRQSMRQLRDMGYACNRSGGDSDPSVLVERMDNVTVTGPHWKIHIGDVQQGLKKLKPKSIHTVITSPPYWGLRSYGLEPRWWPEVTYCPMAGMPSITISAMFCCLGLEDTAEAFIGHLIHVFRGVHDALRDDGVLWVNMGDSYSKDSKYGGASGSKNAPQFEAGCVPRGYRKSGLENGNMVGVPWRLAYALQADGWILRSTEIWWKPSVMPESISGWRWRKCRIKSPRPSRQSSQGHRSENAVGALEKWSDCPGCDKCREHGGLALQRGCWRPTNAHEYIFQLVKSQVYFADGDSSKELASGTAHSRGNGVNPKAARGGESRQNASFSSDVTGLVENRNMRSVWRAVLRSQELLGLARALKRSLLHAFESGITSVSTMWRITSEGFKGNHFAAFPTELPHRCLKASTSRGGCCSACGSQYAPVVRSKRTATRPGRNTKVNYRDIEDNARLADGAISANRDPQRNTTTTVVTGYRATCDCNAPAGRPLVLDCFSGSGTTGQVAINMGCDYIGLEANTEYVDLQIKRLETPWVPRSERKNLKSGKRKRRASDSRQREMF